MTRLIDLKSFTAPILLCRTDAIGDLVLTLPLLEALKKHSPGLEIDLLVSSKTAPLLKNNPHLRNIIQLPDSTLELPSLLRTYNYGAAIAVRPEWGIAAALFRTRIPVRIGTARRAYSPLFTHRVKIRRRYGGRHEAEYNFDLLKPFGIKGTPPHPKLYLTETETEFAREMLQNLGITAQDRFVVIHPGSRGSAPNLPYSVYAEVTKLLSKEYPVLLTGSAEEVRPLVDLLSKKAAGSILKDIHNLAGTTTLRELMALLSLAEMVIASSTGPLHLASALGTKVISYYGLPPEVSAKRWRPWVNEKQYRILEPTVSACSTKCKGNCGRDGCLSSISAEQITTAL
ncbi:glycosyltransferase family 9 protein [bacterium]|nr:glycosyltransferase family 9 protein [bacterium]